MKHLANCTPKEFLVQTNKIRHNVADWLKLTKILDIRKNLPKFEENATKEERTAVLMAQIKRNAGDMLDSMLEEHADETVELLGHLCFVEPEHVNDYPMRDYLACINEMLECPEVLRFFTSLARLGRKNTSGAAKA